jgi:hypothetical protein
MAPDDIACKLVGFAVGICKRSDWFADMIFDGGTAGENLVFYICRR